MSTDIIPVTCWHVSVGDTDAPPTDDLIVLEPSPNLHRWEISVSVPEEIAPDEVA